MMKSETSMHLTAAQLDQFKAEGAVPIPGLVPPDVLEGWQAEFRRACSGDGVDIDDPATCPAGRYAPEGGWPELSPCLYDLPSLNSIVEQLGAGAFAPSHPAGQPWSPQVPMTRVILPSEPGTEWVPPECAQGWTVHCCGTGTMPASLPIRTPAYRRREPEKEPLY